MKEYYCKRHSSVKIREDENIIVFGTNYGIDGALVKRTDFDTIKIESFNVENKGRGRGTEIFECILEYADNNNFFTELVSVPKNYKDLDRLTRFYSKYGFSYEKEGTMFHTGKNRVFPYLKRRPIF